MELLRWASLPLPVCSVSSLWHQSKQPSSDSFSICLHLKFWGTIACIGFSYSLCSFLSLLLLLSLFPILGFKSIKAEISILVQQSTTHTDSIASYIQVLGSYSFPTVVGKQLPSSWPLAGADGNWNPTASREPVIPHDGAQQLNHLLKVKMVR